ncbi:MAG: DNA polymerase III subunit gamma/tau [Halioglobus sp.]
MSYQVLARKWRPKGFREMVGQEHVLRALVNALDNDRLHHAYLFTGTRGVGKTTIARILAKCLNCERGVTSEPCGTCSSCVEIAEGRCVDLLEVDAASRTKVEDTRELLENVQYAPTRARFKVYLIDEVHMLSGHSFNALLKTLEEPPPHVKFLLATTDPQKLPATILSRCLQFNLKNMPPEQIVGHLGSILQAEEIPCEEAALWLLGRAASGSMRDALSLTDQAIAFGSGRITEDDVRNMLGTVDLSFIYRLLTAVAAGEPQTLLEITGHMARHAPDFEGSLDELLSLLHRVAIAQAVPDAVDNSFGDAAQVRELAGGITAEDAQLYYQIALNGKRDITLAPDPRGGFEMVLLRMVAFRPEPAVEEARAAAGPGPSQEAAHAPPPDAVVEVGQPVKKSPESAGPRSPPSPVPDPGAGRGRRAAVSPPARSDDAPGEAAPGDTAPGDTAPEGWPALLEQLGLVGIVYNVASHCELREASGHDFRFVLDPDNASLFNDSHADKIRLALENYFDSRVSVAITQGELQGETPAMLRARLARARQQEAVAEIESDQRLQALIARFDGELDHSSIAPLDS